MPHDTIPQIIEAVFALAAVHAAFRFAYGLDTELTLGMPSIAMFMSMGHKAPWEAVPNAMSWLQFIAVNGSMLTILVVAYSRLIPQLRRRRKARSA